MTDKTKKSRKLSYEILGLFALCFALALILFLFLINVGVGLVEEYCFYNDIILDDDQFYHLETTFFSVSLAVSVIFFAILFIALFADKLSYIRKIIKGVDTLRCGDFGHIISLEGNNELTRLAESVNYLSESERQIKKKEKQLYEEKEELIRTLSHDIRTPLTSIMSYTEFLAAKESCTAEEQREYLDLVQRKTEQIKQLTDILLDGGRRNVEHFDNASLLFEQLVNEFEEALEDNYKVSAELVGINDLSGSFDVQELRRIFDNLISNVQKYADPSRTVSLSVMRTESGIIIKQKNSAKPIVEPSESHRMGINSIRRIAHNYDGGAEVKRTDTEFEIKITLSKF